MADLFEAKAQDWDANERRNRLASAIGSAVLENVTLHARMNVMDFGAGTGLISTQVAPLVARIVAVDTSPAMLKKLAAKPELQGKVEIVCQDLLDDPLEEKFDLIVSAMTLHHVENTERLLQRLHQQLNDGGVIALADLDKEDGSFHPAGTEGVFHFGFDRHELREMLQSQGFHQVEFVTAHTINGEQQDYPIFLVTARRA